MSNEKPPVVLTTTSAHLSKAVDRIRKRFPDKARPDKNLLLNDVADSLRPGKNWGGLLDDARSERQQFNPAPRLPAVLPSAMEIPANAPEIGVLIREVASERGLLDEPPLLEPAWTAAKEEGSLGNPLGVLVHFSGDPWEISVAPVVDFISIYRDEIMLISGYADGSALAAKAALSVIQAAWWTDWDKVLDEPMSTYTSGVAVVVEGRGIAILYNGLFRKIADGASVDPLDDEAIRLCFARGQEADPAIMAMLARLCEAVLPALTAKEMKIKGEFPVRLRIGGPSVQRGVAVGAALPVRPPNAGGDHNVLEEGGWKISEAAIDHNGTSYVAGLLSEALSFAMDYNGVPPDEDLAIIATIHEVVQGTSASYEFDDWDILVCEQQRMRSWRLEDQHRDAIFRGHIIAWMTAGNVEYGPAPEMPKGSHRIVVSRKDRRDSRHWERALALFKSLEDPGEAQEA